MEKYKTLSSKKMEGEENENQEMVTTIKAENKDVWSHWANLFMEKIEYIWMNRFSDQ